MVFCLNYLWHAQEHTLQKSVSKVFETSKPIIYYFNKSHNDSWQPLVIWTRLNVTSCNSESHHVFPVTNRNCLGRQADMSHVKFSHPLQLLDHSNIFPRHPKSGININHQSNLNHSRCPSEPGTNLCSPLSEEIPLPTLSSAPSTKTQHCWEIRRRPRLRLKVDMASGESWACSPGL